MSVGFGGVKKIQKGFHHSGRRPNRANFVKYNQKVHRTWNNYCLVLLKMTVNLVVDPDILVFVDKYG